MAKWSDSIIILDKMIEKRNNHSFNMILACTAAYAFIIFFSYIAWCVYKAMISKFKRKVSNLTKFNKS